MPKYYVTFCQVPNGKIVIDAIDEENAIYKAMDRIGKDENSVEWIEKQIDITGNPLIGISISEAGFVDF